MQRKTLTLPSRAGVKLHPGLRLETQGRGVTTLSPDEALNLANQLLQEGREAIYQDAGTYAPCPQNLVVKATPEGAVLQMAGGNAELTAVLNPFQTQTLADALAQKSSLLQFAGVVNHTKLHISL